MLTRVKEATEIFGQKTTVHGVPRVINASTHMSKVFWIVVCFVALGMFLFLFGSLIVEYYSYEVVTVIKQVRKWLYQFMQFNHLLHRIVSAWCCLSSAE